MLGKTPVSIKLLSSTQVIAKPNKYSGMGLEWNGMFSLLTFSLWEQEVYFLKLLAFLCDPHGNCVEKSNILSSFKWSLLQTRNYKVTEQHLTSWTVKVHLIPLQTKWHNITRTQKVKDVKLKEGCKIVITINILSEFSSCWLFHHVRTVFSFVPSFYRQCSSC